MALLHAQTQRWTREQFARMAETGIVPDRRIELIEGEVVPLPAQDRDHALAVSSGTMILAPALSGRFNVRVQCPLALGVFSQPEPDFAVVDPTLELQAETHPTTAALVIEVAMTSLEYDRSEKSGLYARAGIPEYWIVNLRDRRLEVLRQPGPEPGQPFGHGYRTQQILHDDESISPLCAPDVVLRIADLMPAAG